MTQRSEKLVDVSHPVEHGLVTYRGLPAPIICDYMSREESKKHYAPGTEFQIGKIEMVANTGTYVDAPFHRFADGKDLSEISLSSLANLEGVVIHPDLEKGRSIDASVFNGVNLAGKAVLIHTGWSRHWNTEKYFDGNPFITEEAAVYLSDCGARLVGIDSLNIDDITDGRRPAHTILLGSEIPIAEHLKDLDKLPKYGFRFFAVPVKIKGFGTFPVRAFGIVDDR